MGVSTGWTGTRTGSRRTHDKPFFKTGAGVFVSALAMFVLLWALLPAVIPALFPGDLMLH